MAKRVRFLQCVHIKYLPLPCLRFFAATLPSPSVPFWRSGEAAKQAKQTKMRESQPKGGV